MTTPYLALISDCDGVLLDTEAIAFDVLQRELAPWLPGQDIAAAIQPRLGLTLDALLADMVQHAGLSMTGLDIDLLRDKVENEVDQRLQPVPGVQAAMSAIHLPKAVASNSAAARVRRALQHTGLASLFGQHIYCADEVGIAKPHPGLYLAASLGLGIAAQHCLVVEDSTTGVTAAASAGMTVLGFTGASHVADAQADKLIQCGAVQTFDNMQQLPALVARLLASQ